MRVESTADYFTVARNVEDIKKAILFSKEKNIPFYILGGGSNVIPAKRCKGVVIKIGMKNISLEEKEGFVFADAQAGAFLPVFARKVTEKGAVGMEWAAGVPGMVGGAVRGNAGAFENKTSDFIISVKALDTEKMEEKKFNKEECLFGYRESVFKNSNNLIILSAHFRFPKGEGGEKKMLDYLSFREKRHPKDPSAGSVFKNIKGGIKDENIIRLYPEIEEFNKKGSVPASFLIEKCGLKGTKIGGAQISEKHANFIINTGNATAEDIERLITFVKKKIKEKFGVDMEEEIDMSMR